MYAAGGTGPDSMSPLSSVVKYDPAIDSWTEVGPMDRTLYNHRVETVRLEVNLFDSLIGKAEASQTPV